MKKVMVGILVIIPVIIVLVVALVSVFVSMSAHIAVDDITIDKNYLELEYDPDMSVHKLSSLFNVTVTPDRATNKEYRWSVEDLVCINDDYKEMWDAGTAPPPAFVSDDDSEQVGNPDDLEDETCSSEGYLHINTYCSFVLKVQAETHTATCRVYVVGYKVETINITNTEQTLTIGQNILINVETDPVEAIVDTWIYESTDEDVLTVDRNGVINAVGAGTATIKVKASVYGETGKYVEDSITIKVLDDVTLYGSNITTSRDEVLFAELGVNPADVDIDASVGVILNGAGNGVLLQGNLNVLVVKGEEVVISKCDEGAIIIDNANLFEAKEEGGYVLATDGKLYLTASFADSFITSKPNVTWSSNRETIAKVDDHGVVTGVSNGRVIITATTDDGKSTSVTINVREVVTVLLVETPEACLNQGIARETINGSMVYVDVLGNIDDLTYYVPNVNDFNFTKKDNSFEFNFQRPALPEGANAEEFYSAFNFKVEEYVGQGEDRHLEESDKARFESNRMYFNGDKIDELVELVVTISAKYPKFITKPEYTTVQFTIKVTKGINVSSWVDLLAVAEENKKATDESSKWDMILATNIARADGFVPDDILIAQLEAIEAKVNAGKNLNDEDSALWIENGESKGLKWLKDMRSYAKSQAIQLRNNLYGNGNMIYGFKAQYNGVSGGGDGLFHIVESGVTVSNAIIRTCEVGDFIINDIEDTQGLTGNGIRLQSTNVSNYANRLTDNVIEYCILENTGTAIRCYGADFTINGCIVRNTSETAMYIPINRNDSGVRYSHVTLNNCVFSNMLGTSMSVAFQNFSDDNNPESVAQALKDQEEGRTFVLTQTGFWDIYNWQSADVLNIIPEVESININVLISDALEESPKFKAYSRIYEQTDYFHVGFMISGFDSITNINTPYPVCTFEDERLQMVDSNELFKDAGTSGAILLGALKEKPFYLYTYGQNGNLTPGTTYQVNNRLIRHLHGEV